MTMTTVLEVDQLTKNFGGLAAVSNVSMEFRQGELIGLIGPNGAGKTTTFNLLTGVYTPSEGTVRALNANNEMEVINGVAPYKINQLGLARTFQNIRLFADMTVLQNVMIAMHGEQSNSMWSSLFRTKAFYDNEDMMATKAYDLLKLFKLEGLAEEKAKNLAYGQQRHLEIIRALATEPKILFLDEPAAGMNPAETQELTEMIDFIRHEFDLTIVLIEHDMGLVMDICERIYVLEYGRLIFEGTAKEAQNDPTVIQAYLGGEA